MYLVVAWKNYLANTFPAFLSLSLSFPTDKDKGKYKQRRHVPLINSFCCFLIGQILNHLNSTSLQRSPGTFEMELNDNEHYHMFQIVDVFSCVHFDLSLA